MAETNWFAANHRESQSQFISFVWRALVLPQNIKTSATILIHNQLNNQLSNDYIFSKQPVKSDLQEQLHGKCSENWNSVLLGQHMPQLNAYEIQSQRKSSVATAKQPPSTLTTTAATITESTLISNGVNTRTRYDTLFNKCNIKFMCIAFWGHYAIKFRWDTLSLYLFSFFFGLQSSIEIEWIF